ncbi:hypothetical protein GQ457_16G012020 [Hibiscus cannabinus]
MKQAELVFSGLFAKMEDEQLLKEEVQKSGFGLVWFLLWYCLRHIAANYLQRLKNEDERNAHFIHEVEELLEEVRVRNSEDYNYLVKILREKRLW